MIKLYFNNNESDNEDLSNNNIENTQNNRKFYIQKNRY